MADAKLHMLTTVDNPFNPFTHYNEWDAWDRAAGYNTASFLARVTITSTELSDRDYDNAIEQAIDDVIRENVLGVYRKIAEDGSFGD